MEKAKKEGQLLIELAQVKLDQCDCTCMAARRWQWNGRLLDTRRLCNRWWRRWPARLGTLGTRVMGRLGGAGTVSFKKGKVV